MNQEKTASFEDEKMLFHQDNAPCHKSIKKTVKLHELAYELLPHSSYSPGVGVSSPKIICLNDTYPNIIEHAKSEKRYRSTAKPLPLPN
jgi:hypothetical protein